jgi:hypothetical protein
MIYELLRGFSCALGAEETILGQNAERDSNRGILNYYVARIVSRLIERKHSDGLQVSQQPYVSS